MDYFPDTAAFIKQQIGSPTVLLGHSGGAMAALGAAAQIPELTRAVVLLDPPFIQRETSTWPKSTNDFMAGVYDILTHRRTVREVLPGFFPDIGQAGIQWFDDTFSWVDPELVKVLLDGRYFEGLKLEELLNKVTCPVLMLYGEVEKGALVRESDVAFFLAHTGNGTAVQIKGTGHYLHAEQPARILELSTQWIENLK
jgi:pimeloyl-ACP methyl ester carboxylesterase